VYRGVPVLVAHCWTLLHQLKVDMKYLQYFKYRMTPAQHSLYSLYGFITHEHQPLVEAARPPLLPKASYHPVTGYDCFRRMAWCLYSAPIYIFFWSDACTRDLLTHVVLLLLPLPPPPLPPPVAPTTAAATAAGH
jgi:hypothetical protein